MHGGFVVDVREIKNKIKYVTLTPEAVLELARRGHFLRLERDTISNKSEADVLAKSLVCIQVLWFLVQCLARKYVGYPLSILEIHTFVHVVCAMLMYSLWFQVSFHGVENLIPRCTDTSDFRSR